MFFSIGPDIFSTMLPDMHKILTSIDYSQGVSMHKQNRIIPELCQY